MSVAECEIQLDSQAMLSAVRKVLGNPHDRGEGLIPLHEPEFAGKEWDYVKECIDTGWVSSVGKFVDRFEDMLAEFTGANRAVAVANGTAALHVSLLLAGVEPGDEVLVPTMTFIATANAVSYAGATPHFIDSEPQALGVDVAKLEAYLQDVAELRQGVCVNRRTGAVVRALAPVHIFGHIGDIAGLQALCQRWGLVLVEDAAEALGSTYGGRHAGTFGMIASTSFNGNKTITTGGGGAILTNDAKLGARAKHLTTTARVSHRWSFLHDEIGFNYRMPNLNAALGCAQLERLPDMLARKRRLAQAYIEAFQNVPGAAILPEPEGTTSNYWLVAMRLDRADEAHRDAVLLALNDAGYMARPVWTLMHRLPMYRDCPRMDLAMAEDLDLRLINLPSSARLAPR